MKESNLLTFIFPESGDYTVAFLNGKQIYAGHDRVNMLMLDVLDAIGGIEYESIELPDDEFEEKYS